MGKRVRRSAASGQASDMVVLKVFLPISSVKLVRK